MWRKKQIKNTLNFCRPFLQYQKESKSTCFLTTMYSSKQASCLHQTNFIVSTVQKQLVFGNYLKTPNFTKSSRPFLKFKQRPLLAEVGCGCNASSVFDWTRIWYIYSLRFFGLHHQLWPVPTMSKSISPLACNSCVSFKMSLRKKEHAHAILR